MVPSFGAYAIAYFHSVHEVCWTDATGGLQQKEKKISTDLEDVARVVFDVPRGLQFSERLSSGGSLNN